MRRFLPFLILLVCTIPAGAAVSHDATMTGGNGTGGAVQQCGAATSCSSTGMTVGAGATLLIVGLTGRGATADISAPVCTWNSVSMTKQSSILNGTNGTDSHGNSTLFTLTLPATGNKTASCTWTNTADEYMTAVSWNGTDTTTGVNATNNVTSSNATSIAVTSDANGASVAIANEGGAGPTVNFTQIFSDGNLSPDAAASYQLGGTSNSHTFTDTRNMESLAGVHIIASSSGAACVPSLMLTHAGGPC